MRIIIDTTGLDRLNEARRRGLLRVQEADLLYAGNRQVTRILERTAAGRDWQGVPFIPYKKSDRPYYYYPTSPSGLARDRAAIAKRYVSRMAKNSGTLTRGGIGIKFASYGDMKIAMGRLGVDLYGMQAPHMLQALVATVVDGMLWIGIYGNEAARADGHNEGTETLPRRHFLDVNADELRQVGEDVAFMMGARYEAIMAGTSLPDPKPPARQQRPGRPSVAGVTSVFGAIVNVGSKL